MTNTLDWSRLHGFPVVGSVGVALLLAACTGNIEGNNPAGTATPPGTAGTSGIAGGPTAPIVEPDAHGDITKLPQSHELPAGLLGLRGLTRAEYDNTVSAMLGEPASLTGTWGDEIGDAGGFPTARPASALEVQAYFDAAEAVAARVKSAFKRVWACDTTSQGESACAEQFVKRFGRAAFRRPVLDSELQSFTGLFQTARSTHSLALEDSAALVAEAISQSPSFMYHWELGPQRPLAGADGKVTLTAYEAAARLSYFLTQAPPDAQLAADADSGKTLDSQVLTGHAARLLGGATTAQLFELLVAKMLHLRNDSKGVNGLDASLLESRHRFIGSTLGNMGGSIQALLLSSDYYVNAQLAPLYGIDGVDGDTLVKKAMDPEQRMGILTHADYLKYTGKADDSLPPRRGEKLLLEFLCQATPAPPLIPTDLVREPGQTQREFFANVVEQKPCAMACHATIDPLGYAFEHFGGSAWRDVDPASQKPINSTGSVTLPFGQVVHYEGAPDLVQAIAGSEEYRQCMTRQVFRMATGRAEAGYDVDSLKSALTAQRAAHDDLHATLVDVTGSEAFRFRRLNEGELAR
jgi:Protein of unknown function (DUF1592)/Protein of unknown function (DUF1595)/Protein of unknown function (DUF1588)/Protein of unknown function (DUF1585)/Protein of unknown function (DUF1587)